MHIFFSHGAAVVTEQTKKSGEHQIILGQMRWLYLQNESLSRTEENRFNAILGLTLGISEPLGNSEMAGALAVRGHGRATTADSTSEPQAPGPANLSSLQPSAPSWPGGGACSFLASAGATPRAGGQTASSRHLSATGLQEGTEPLLCRAPFRPLPLPPPPRS